ncbi:hypothetical protein K8R42_00865 [bacterium]|nr:hypothetical protein [bacterium]
MTKVVDDKKDIEDNKVIAAIGYVGVLCFVPLLLKKDSKFSQFHGKQGLMLFLLEIAGFIPVIGWALFIAAVILAIFGIRATLDGKYWELPILGQYAKKLNL